MLKHRFTRFLTSNRLHLAAHSHHLWPDVAFEAQQRAWLDAARLVDDKWDVVFDRLIPSLQQHLARHLGSSDPPAIAFAPNTHEFVVRIASCLEAPFRLVTTDAEFHSFRRQAARWEEAGVAHVERVATEPFATFPERFVAAIEKSDPDLVYFSHVTYDSGYVTPNLEEIVFAPRDDAFVVVDGYHHFLARKTDIGPIEDRAFYLAGGYKYAMSGEGVCFMHCPGGFGNRPIDTGWMAGFGALTSTDTDVGYSDDGFRFFGATFDPTAMYRMDAVMDMLGEEDIGGGEVHAHVAALQSQLITGLVGSTVLADQLLPAWGTTDRGNFLTFRTPDAERIYRKLHDRHVITDRRGDRLRLGFGVYHDADDIDRALIALGA